ncbi:MAG: undecaprenyl-phosphate glucose phosphotransferase [Pseudomonadota bacterium]
MLPRGLLKEYAGPLSYMLRALDVAAVVGSALLAYTYKFGDLQLPIPYRNALIIAGIFTFFIFSFFRIYESVRTKNFWVHILTLLKALGLVFTLLMGLAFLTKTGEDFSRIWFVYWVAIALVLLTLFRASLLISLRIMRANRWNERRVIVIGVSELSNRLVDSIQQALWTGFRIMAVFDDTGDHGAKTIGGLPVLPMPKDIGGYLKSQKESIDEIWLAMPLSAESRVKKLLHELRHQIVTIRMVLDVFGFGLLKSSVTDLAGFPALNLSDSPMVGLNRLIKAVEDRVLAAIILILISPLFLLIALGVKLSSKGPIYFKQLRHGWDGRIIKVYKFRTMVLHDEAAGQVTQARANDRRITPFGKFLRKTSLDELPQFINVLQGRMSIVGPRPHAVSHNEFYKDSIKAYMQRHKVKPGITGWAQVNGWRGETETLDKMEKRVEYDLYYIEHWSLSFDLKIILLTFFQGFINKNAY